MPDALFGPIFPSLLMNNAGNPWVKFLDPYPYPPKSLPLSRGMGFGRQGRGYERGMGGMGGFQNPQGFI